MKYEERLSLGKDEDVKKAKTSPPAEPTRLPRIPLSEAKAKPPEEPHRITERKNKEKK